MDERSLHQSPDGSFPRALNDEVSAPFHESLLTLDKLFIVQRYVPTLDRFDERTVKFCQSRRTAKKFERGENSSKE